MQRIQKVEQYVREFSGQSKEKMQLGVTAEMTAEALQIWRNDASRDLNRLVKEGVLEKTNTYPVRFCLKKNPAPFYFAADDEMEPFVRIVGYDGSLRGQIRTAKAAASYPPFGLNTFIVGESGVGKTMLAEEIWKYVCAFRKDKSVPFITYNCAEHTDNPQLLLSHLFGHVKGAFTGADRDKEGIVALSNGGILFLDEIHRLPMTGQEMLFTVMDKGIFRPLGSVKTKQANLMIIGATTEKIDSALLDTFKRRMPIIIKIPSLGERSLKERLDLVTLFFMKESQKLSMPIWVEKEAIRYLTAFESKTNIGDLKNEVQICCAKGYLRFIEQENTGTDAITIIKKDVSRKIVVEQRKAANVDAFVDAHIQGEYVLITGEDVQLNPVKTYSADEKQERQDAAMPEDSLGLVSLNSWKMAEWLVEKAEIELDSIYDSNTVNSLAVWLEQIHLLAQQGEVGGNSLFHKLSADVGLSPQSGKERNFLTEIMPIMEERFGTRLMEEESFFLLMLLRQHSRNKYEKVDGVPYILVLASKDRENNALIAKYINEVFNMKLIYPVYYNEKEKESIEDVISVIKMMTQIKGAIILTEDRDFLKKKKYIQKQTNVSCYIMTKINVNLIIEMAKAIMVADRSQGMDSIIGSVKRKEYVDMLMGVFK